MIILSKAFLPHTFFLVGVFNITYFPLIQDVLENEDIQLDWAFKVSLMQDVIEVYRLFV